MSGAKDRRTEGRVRVQTQVKVTHQDRGKVLGKFDLVELSGRGFSFLSWDRFAPGTHLWCEVRDFNLCVSAEVCHSRGLFRKLTGVRFLNSPCCVD